MENQEKKYFRIVEMRYVNAKEGVKGLIRLLTEGVYVENVANVVCNYLNENNANVNSCYTLEEVEVSESNDASA